MEIHTCFRCKTVFPNLWRCPQCGTDITAQPSPAPAPEPSFYLPPVPTSDCAPRWNSLDELRESDPAGSVGRLLIDGALKKMGLLKKE